MKDSWRLCEVLADGYYNQEFRSEVKLRCKPQSLSAHCYPASVSQLIHVTEPTETRKKTEWKILLVTGQLKCKSKPTRHRVQLCSKVEKCFILFIYWNRLCIKEGWATKLFYIFMRAGKMTTSIHIYTYWQNQSICFVAVWSVFSATHNTQHT